MATHPTPTRKHFARLGLHHGATLAQCSAAFDESATFYDPRRWPVEHQAWIIDVQNETAEAMSVIYDAARLGVGR